MSEKRFNIEIDENYNMHLVDSEIFNFQVLTLKNENRDDGIYKGLFRISKLLNNLYKENEDLKKIVDELYDENHFLNSLLEEYEDKMFSEKDFSNYLQACHQGKVENIKR